MEDAIRNRLLAEHDLSWKRACEIAIQMDMARYGSKLNTRAVISE